MVHDKNSLFKNHKIVKYQDKESRLDRVEMHKKARSYLNLNDSGKRRKTFRNNTNNEAPHILKNSKKMRENSADPIDSRA